MNTCGDRPRTGLRTPESAENGRDTRRLYALYSVVFRCHLHTISACKPYCRKGFQICIQCIQRIPTPLVFRFFMNTVNTPAGTKRRSRHGSRMMVDAVRGRSRRRRTGTVPASDAAAGPGQGGRFVFSGPCEYAPPPSAIGVSNAENGRNRPRHTPVVCIVFSCIQTPNAYKISPSALLP